MLIVTSRLTANCDSTVRIRLSFDMLYFAATWDFASDAERSVVSDGERLTIYSPWDAAVMTASPINSGFVADSPNGGAMW